MTTEPKRLTSGIALSALGGVLVLSGFGLWSTAAGTAALLMTIGTPILFGGLLDLLTKLEVPSVPKSWQIFAYALGFWLAVDQATKWGATKLRVGVDEIPVIPGWLSAVHAQNFGAAFSSMEGQYALFLVFVAIATVIVFNLVRQMRHDDTFMAMTLGMILSGAWGNGLDRLRIGHVTDFIRVYTDSPGPKAWLIENFGTNTWPIFNIADSALLVGVTLFLVHYLFIEEHDEATTDPDTLLTSEG